MTTDPQALRALAHPLRWKLIDVLEREGSATATRCAELLGESVASCAYHLGILAKYGYIEVDPARSGREKPWRMTARQQRLGGEGLDAEGWVAAEAAIEAFLEHEFGRVRQQIRLRDREPAEWREATGAVGSTLWVTAQELLEIKQQLRDIATRFDARDDDPSQRPEGARQARLFGATVVLPAQPDESTEQHEQHDTNDMDDTNDTDEPNKTAGEQQS